MLTIKNKHTRILIFIVCAVLGFMITMQLKSQQRYQTVSVQRAEELSVRLKEVQADRDKLDKELSEYRAGRVSDTVQKEIPYRGVVKRGFFEDLSMQIGIILHDHLSEAEVAELNEKERKNKPFGENAGVVLRVDSTKRKVLQVTCFLFYNHYVAARDRAARGWQREGDPVAYDGFWLNFDPDRLYAIEKDIVKRLVLPEDTPEMYLNDDFEVYVCPDQILDPEKAKAKKEAEEAEQKASREYWQKRNQMYKL